MSSCKQLMRIEQQQQQQQQQQMRIEQPKS